MRYADDSSAVAIPKKCTRGAHRLENLSMRTSICAIGIAQSASSELQFHLPCYIVKPLSRRRSRVQVSYIPPFEPKGSERNRSEPFSVGDAPGRLRAAHTAAGWGCAGISPLGIYLRPVAFTILGEKRPTARLRTRNRKEGPREGEAPRLARRRTGRRLHPRTAEERRATVARRHTQPQRQGGLRSVAQAAEGARPL